ncbi:hypothetical protein Tco_1531660 [Tanacetum coccineum]
MTRKRISVILEIACVVAMYSLPLSENESFNFDHHDDPSFPRPPLEPPDVEICLNFEPDTGVLTTKMVKGISKHYVLMPNILLTLPTLDPDSDFTPYHGSLGFENKIFDPGIFIEVQSERLLSQIIFPISFIPSLVWGIESVLMTRIKTKRFSEQPCHSSKFRLDHEDPCLFSILQSLGLRSFTYFGICGKRRGRSSYVYAWWWMEMARSSRLALVDHHRKKAEWHRYRSSRRMRERPGGKKPRQHETGGGGEVNRGGVDLGVSKQFSLELIVGDSGGVIIREVGGAPEV